MKRVVNGILGMVLLILAGWYGRSAFFTAAPDNNRDQSAQAASYILFGLFLVLAIVLGSRALRSK